MTTTGAIIAAHRAARGKLQKGLEAKRGPSYATPEQIALLRSQVPPCPKHGMVPDDDGVATLRVESERECPTCHIGFLLRVVAPEDQGVVFETGCWLHGGPGPWEAARPCSCPILDFPVDVPKDAQPEAVLTKLGPVTVED
jgi:hypothetical protein